MYLRIRLIIFVLLGIFSLQSAYAKGPKAKPYRKREIVEARFGNAQMQALLTRAYNFAAEVRKSVVGQDRAAMAAQLRLVQYLENFGTRTKEPIALHLIGLPGIGKSALLDVLEKLGIGIVRVDAQAYADPGVDLTSLRQEIKNTVERYRGKPMIVLFDEIDKVPEIVRGGGGAEVTSPLIGMMNQILTEGKMSWGTGGEVVNLSNAFVVSAMNLSPEEIERFSEEVLKKKKSFYDFTIEDFRLFDEWLKSEQAAKYKVLSHLFRSNTVSRLAPNAVIVKPISEEDYRMIIRIGIEAAVYIANSKGRKDKRIEVTYSESLIDYLYKRVVFPASGARETVTKTNSLTQQLINFATRAHNGDKSSLAIPRQIRLEGDQNLDHALIQITPRYRRGTEMFDKPSFTVPVEYNGDLGSFVRPPEVSVAPPKVPASKSKYASGERPVTQKEILEARFPRGRKATKGLAKKLNQEIFGQEEMADVIESELSAFAGRSGPVKKNPPFKIIAGFPGIGKSEIVNLSSQFTEIPIVRLNLQAFSSEDGGILFLKTLHSAIGTVLGGDLGRDKKFILLLEEMDKIFEIDPQTGKFIDRPVMTYIKDLMNSGFLDAPVPSTTSGTERLKIDIRNAYTFITMNFAVDRFGFEADPRLTTIEDLMKVWRTLKTRLSDMKKLLGSMFLPDTVNRILPRFLIMRPLTREAHQKIVLKTVREVVDTRLIDPKTGRNLGQIDVRLSADYKEYLYRESVVPSEGGRKTSITVDQHLVYDLEEILKKIPRSSQFAKRPITIEIDFREASSAVVARVKLATDGKDVKGIEIYNRAVELNFPSLKVKGKVPQKRLFIAVHEFGHAYAAVRLGRRIDYVSVVPPKNGLLGYVRYTDGDADAARTAQSLFVEIYTALASRAMERIFTSDNPRDQASVQKISLASSQDIADATTKLWAYIYEAGLDPEGGVINRRGVNGGQYPVFSDIPAEEVEKLSHILKKIENYIVDDFLESHSREWYVEKVTNLAKAGGLDEKEFYELLDRPLENPESSESLGERSLLDKIFEKVIAGDNSKEALADRSYRDGDTGTTAEENLQRANEFLRGALSELLHGGPKVRSAGLLNSSCPISMK